MVGAWMMGDAEIGEDQPAQNLDAAFLCRIGRRSEPARQIAIESMLGP
jgi:hypothetical protein